MLNKVLVPLDGSPLAERALEPAITLARPDGAELILLRVPVAATMAAPMPAGVSGSGFGLLWPTQALEHATTESEGYLERVAQAHAGINIRTLTAQGDVAEAIVDVAAKEGADLIVMSSHGRTGLSRWMYGSIAERALRAAPCPVMVLRSQRPIQKVLITLDGSELSARALAPGLEVAGRFGAHVALLRAVPPVDREEIAQLDELEPGLGTRWVEEHVREARHYLKEMAAKHRATGRFVETVARVEPAATAILDYAHENGADLIVMATHGRTGLERWAYGSVTEKVLRAGIASMFIVRPPSKELA